MYAGLAGLTIEGAWNVCLYHSMWVLTLIIPLRVRENYTQMCLKSVRCYIHQARFSSFRNYVIRSIFWVCVCVLEFLKRHMITTISAGSNTGLLKMMVGFLTTRLATSFSRCKPMWFLSMGLRQGSGLCSSCSRKYPGTEATNQNRHWNHHSWHATNSLERNRLSCWCS